MKFDNLNQLTPEYIKNMEARFKTKYTVRDDGCHEWTASLCGSKVSDGHGYGSFGVMIDSKKRTQRAHRVAYILKNGSIPDKGVLEHACNFTRCVNPEHLTIGTVASNTKAGFNNGRKSVSHTFTKSERVALKKFILSGATDTQVKQFSIANFGKAISGPTISKARTGKTWANI